MLVRCRTALHPAFLKAPCGGVRFSPDGPVPWARLGSHNHRYVNLIRTNEPPSCRTSCKAGRRRCWRTPARRNGNTDEERVEEGEEEEEEVLDEDDQEEDVPGAPAPSQPAGVHLMVSHRVPAGAP